MGGHVDDRGHGGRAQGGWDQDAVGSTGRRLPRDAVERSAVKGTAKELIVPYRSVNPTTGEILRTFIEHTDQEMMDALAKADNAFVSWAARPIEERAKIIAAQGEALAAALRRPVSL